MKSFRECVGGIRGARVAAAAVVCMGLGLAGYGQDAVASKTGAATVPGLTKTRVVNLGDGVNMEFVLVRPGSFQMGSESCSAREKPVHKVTMTNPFYIGKYEVTQEQWQAVMGANPSSTKGPKLPVTDVSWEECRQFAAKLAEGGRGAAGTFSLPTEAEWEYACRAGITTAFSFGDNEAGLGDSAWFFRNAGGKTHEVGTRKPNAWGLYDMHGNVWEWCQDWYKESYPDGDDKDPAGPVSGSHRVVRSISFDAGYCRSAYRAGFDPDCCWGASAAASFSRPQFSSRIVQSLS